MTIDGRKRGTQYCAQHDTVTTPTTTRIRFLAARAKKARRPAPARAIFHVRASARCITYNPADHSRPHNKPRGGRPPTIIGANPEKGGATSACTDKRSRSEARNLLPNAEATSPPPPPTRHPVPVATWLAKNKHHNLGCIQRHEQLDQPRFRSSRPVRRGEAGRPSASMFGCCESRDGGC